MIPALLLAQDPAAGGPDLTRYLTVCAFLILLVLVLGLGFRRLVHGTLKGRAAQRALETLDVLPLGGKQKVAVVRCYDRSYLIGLGDKEVRLLAALDEESGSTAEAPALTMPAAHPAPVRRAPSGSFLETLRRSVRSAAPVAEAAEPAPPRAMDPAPRRPRSERPLLPGKGLLG